MSTRVPLRPVAWILIMSVCQVHADLYMHAPRGSNNKLNEVSNNAQNQNRLFDSQNNAAGGYQVGDNCYPVCSQNPNANPAGGNSYDRTKPGAGEGEMYYYEGSYLHIEWTNQHGCGAAQKNVRCELVLQYMCDEPDGNPDLRNGQTTNTVGGNNDQNPPTLTEYQDPLVGVHEPLTWYENCYERERNKGLYTADQNLNNPRTRARNTRQNPNGQRRGLECPEERDYYPYWHPTPWRDIAVFTDEQHRCPYYLKHSQNRRDYGMCCNATLWDRDGVCIQQLGDTSNDQNNNPTRGPNNPGACLANADYAGKWVEFGGWWTDEPQCERTPFSRDNHLGNSVPKASESGGLGAMSRAPSYKWKIPDDVLKKTGRESARCVLRMRYNISTTDFDDWSIDATLNGNDAPVKQDPAADFLGLSSSTSLGTDYPLKLNIATNQYGRTFEDRSHTFQIRRRDGAGSCKDKEIHNLNIRGRRGNIVQVYPAVEYDYVPNKLEIFEGECVHFQWTGSDANPRGNAGNGRQMTDRVNIVEIPELGKNVPTKLGYDAVADGVEDDLKHESLLGDEAFVKRLAYLDQELNCTSGTCIPTLSCDDDQTNNQAISNCKELNAARGYFDTGPVQLNTPLFYTKTQSVHFMSTRNNDFTNRSQKGTIVIKAWKFGLILGLVIFALCALVFFGYLNARKAHYDPEHRLHRNKFGRWVIKMGKRAEKLYERSPLAKVPYTCGLIVMCAAFYAIGYYHAIGGDPAPYFVHAKGCGRVLDLLCNLIFVPVLRNLTSWLRTTSLSNVLPLGEELYFHKTIAVIMSLAAAGHILSHYLDYQWHAAYGTGTSLAEQAVGTWTGISGHLIALMMILMFSTALEKVRRRRWLRKTKWAFGGHSLFVRVHKLWIPVLVLLWSHSKAFWHYSLAPTTLILLDKLIARLRGKEPVELVEASSPTRDVIALKMRKRNHRKFRYKSGQYLFLNCPSISATEWHPFTISSSPEERNFSVHIRCRPDMDWTYALKQAVLPDEKTKAAQIEAQRKLKIAAEREEAEAAAKRASRAQAAESGQGSIGFGAFMNTIFGGAAGGEPEPNLEDAPLQGEGARKRTAKNLFASRTKTGPGASTGPAGNGGPTPPASPPDGQVIDITTGAPVELYVDGPYGTASEEVFGFEVLILVGAGIGVTPFASILKTLAIQAKQDRLETQLKKVAFYWVCRDDKEFETFRDLLVGIVDDRAIASIFELNTYITGELDLKKAKSDKSYGYNQFAGKPDWNRIGKGMRTTYPESDIGVFLCGPAAIGNQLDAMCKKFNPPKQKRTSAAYKVNREPRFHFFKENF